jgi:apolipoprotein N-acyltransferase
VWGVSALVTFPSFWLSAALKDFSAGEGIKGIGRAAVSFFGKEKISAIVWTAVLSACLVFGIVSVKDFSSYPSATIALVQHNTDPWEASKAPHPIQILEAYRKDLSILKRLSDEALASAPKPQLVVWPETAFVPRIHWQTTHRDNQNFWQIVKELLEYLSTKDAPFLIGNDDARMEPAKNPNRDERNRVDYNAAILFENGQISGIYRKLHLVPFTEYFPYSRQFPAVYRALKKADTHFWEKGEEATVFSGPGFTFSAPICFEDTFGYLSGNFVRRGADVLINLSNDAWSNSLPAQNQHLSTAVFRAVENCRPMVRSTVSGQTCIIDPNGRITAMAKPFTEAWLKGTVPIVKENTLYTKYGDYLGFIFTLSAAIMLILGALWGKIKR